MSQRPVTLTDIVAGHVSLDIEGFDRIYLNGWVPALQTSGQVAGWRLGWRGFPIVSTPDRARPARPPPRPDPGRLAGDHPTYGQHHRRRPLRTRGLNPCPADLRPAPTQTQTTVKVRAPRQPNGTANETRGDGGDGARRRRRLPSARVHVHGSGVRGS
jgi:hypothetical protein